MKHWNPPQSKEEGTTALITRHFLQLEGVRVSYLEKGTATAGSASLVFVHGLMGTAATLRALMKATRPDLHVIALDLPGAGLSDRGMDLDTTLAGNAKYVARVIEALGLDRPVLVGHSHGGAVAMQLAATAPGLTRSLVLLSPAHPYFSESDPVIRFYLSLPGRLFAYTMPWYPRWFQMLGLRRMAGPKSWDEPKRLLPYRENLRIPGTMTHLLKLLTTWKSDMAELGRLLRRPLATPAMLIWGDADRAVPSGSAMKLRAHLAASELHTLPGIGHRPAEETPETTAALIGAWLDRNCTPLQEVFLPARGVASAQRPKVARSQSFIAPLMASSFEAGD